MSLRAIPSAARDGVAIASWELRLPRRPRDFCRVEARRWRESILLSPSAVGNVQASGRPTRPTMEMDENGPVSNPPSFPGDPLPPETVPGSASSPSEITPRADLRRPARRDGRVGAARTGRGLGPRSARGSLIQILNQGRRASPATRVRTSPPIEVPVLPEGRRDGAPVSVPRGGVSRVEGPVLSRVEGPVLPEGHRDGVSNVEGRYNPRAWLSRSSRSGISHGWRASG